MMLTALLFLALFYLVEQTYFVSYYFLILSIYAKNSFIYFILIIISILVAIYLHEFSIKLVAFFGISFIVFYARKLMIKKEGMRKFIILYFLLSFFFVLYFYTNTGLSNSYQVIVLFARFSLLTILIVSSMYDTYLDLEVKTN